MMDCRLALCAARYTLATLGVGASAVAGESSSTHSDLATTDNEDKPGVILDYDAEGNLVAVEVQESPSWVQPHLHYVTSWRNRLISMVSVLSCYNDAVLCGRWKRGDLQWSQYQRSSQDLSAAPAECGK